MITDKIRKGTLLVAEPYKTFDLFFNKSVILLADHNNSGTVGFILNKPTIYSINDLIPEIEADFIIYEGGPVEQGNLYFIHNVPELIPNSIEISEGIFWCGDLETIKYLINTKQLSNENIRFFLGYSGWDITQLEDEIKSNTWIIVKNTYENSIIKQPHANFWKNQLKEIGGHYLIWLNAPLDPSMN